MGGPTVAYSAPGKVLLAGGYLVLDRAHTGLVFGLNARIHVVVQELKTCSGVDIHGITVKSPQFPGAIWQYGYSLHGEGAGISVTQLTSGGFSTPRNPFVETALAYALSYVVAETGSFNIASSVVTILADDDYYSASSDLTSDASELVSSTTRKSFKTFKEPLWEANKTGLGSSAALVTSLTAALVSHYLPRDTLDLHTATGQQILHNLAQASHCAAQGKVGSGFDVASAVFGSSVYRRFSPSILEAVGDLHSAGFLKKLRACVNDTDKVWDVEVKKDAVTIPRGLKLVMCDVDCGSKTPGMVKQVLQWRKDNAEQAGALWSALQFANDDIARELVSAANSTASDYSNLSRRIERSRELIREMSERSNVPIEPEPQTKLLDACSKLEGVVGGVVPGAGGYDAVAILVQDDPNALKRLSRLLHGWSFEASGSSGRVRLMRTEGELEGLRYEDVGSYKTWLSS